MHEQPSWPFPLRPGFAVMADADLAAEVWLGAAMLAGSAGALLALARRPVRRRAPWAAGKGITAIDRTPLPWTDGSRTAQSTSMVGNLGFPVMQSHR